MTAAYVAPARYVLTELHEPDPAAGTPPCPATGEATTGWTKCGTPMLESELWQPLDLRPGDRLCGVCCFGAAEAPAGMVQDTLL